MGPNPGALFILSKWGGGGGGGKWLFYGNFLGKCPENLHLLNQKFRKFLEFWEENQMKQKFAARHFGKFGCTWQG